MKITPHYYPIRNCYRLYLPVKLSSNGKRQAKYFDSLPEAEDFIAKFQNKARSVRREVVVTEQDRAILETAKERLGGPVDDLLKAVEFYRKNFLAIWKTSSVQEMCNAFLIYQEKIKGLSKRTLADDRYRMREFVKAFNRFDPREIKKSDIVNWIDSFRKGSNRANMHKAAHKLLKWAKLQGYIAMDVMEGLERPKAKSAKQILPIGQFEMMLRYCAGLEPLPPAPAKLEPQYGYKLFDDFRPILPALVLGGFAGLRTGEMLKVYATDQTIQWQDIDWSENLIHIRNEVGKQTRRESNQRFIPLEPAVGAWLKQIAKPAGPVLELAESAFREYRRQLVARMNIGFPKNVLRNSYASYAYSIRSGGEVAKAMGDLEETVRRHYIETMKPGTGKAWFGIRPDVRKVLTMPVSA